MPLNTLQCFIFVCGALAQPLSTQYGPDDDNFSDDLSSTYSRDFISKFVSRDLSPPNLPTTPIRRRERHYSLAEVAGKATVQPRHANGLKEIPTLIESRNGVTARSQREKLTQRDQDRDQRRPSTRPSSELSPRGLGPPQPTPRLSQIVRRLTVLRSEHFMTGRLRYRALTVPRVQVYDNALHERLMRDTGEDATRAVLYLSGAGFPNWLERWSPFVVHLGWGLLLYGYDFEVRALSNGSSGSHKL